jgi:nucleotide-binding universal stress UspA family protein
MTLRPIQSLLCPIDLERPTLDALAYAFFLAEAFYASLEVISTRTPSTPLPSSTGARRQAADRAVHSLNEHASRGRLEELLRGVTTAVPGRASAHVVDGGPISGVVRCALQFRSDLVVVGSHFEARPDWMFGASHGEQIAHAAPCPTVSLHEGGQRAATRVKHILVPVASRSEVLSLEWSTLFARCFDATVELLHVPASPEPHGAHRGDARDQRHVTLDALQDTLRVSGVRVDEARDDDGTALERILKRTESGGCDLVVMVEQPDARKMTAAEPSLTARVRRHATIPVLTVRPSGSHLTLVPEGEESETPPAERGMPDWDERA